MKSTLLVTFLVFLGFIFSCEKKGDANPAAKNSFTANNLEYSINTATYGDYGLRPNGEYKMAFTWKDLDNEALQVCETKTCEINSLSILVYSQSEIPQNATFVLDLGYSGANHATAILQLGGTKHEIISGTIELIGTGTSDLHVKLEGRLENGEEISGEYKGEYTEEDVPTLSNSFIFSDKEYSITTSFFLDYGSYGNNYNIEFYWLDASLDDVKACNDGSGDCNITGILLDLYNDKPILSGDIYYLDENYDGPNWAYAEVIIGDTSNSPEIVSGTVKVEGTSTDDLIIQLDGLLENGESIYGEFQGFYYNVENLENLRTSNSGKINLSKRQKPGKN
jgi:hypothetical protein